MKKSEILRMAAEKVTKPEQFSEYLCDCVWITTREDFGSDSLAIDKAKSITNEISNLLEGYNSIDRWLEKKHNVQPSELSTNWDQHWSIHKPTEKLQQYRKAWALHLAQQYESEGD